jgi:hypothetical protein
MSYAFTASPRLQTQRLTLREYRGGGEEKSAADLRGAPGL